jgi:predicted homoserine dehydrogenase-like protein
LALAQGCRLKRDVAKDQPLTYRDVEIPEGRLCDRLRAEQNEWFFSDSDPHRETRIPTRAGCS